MVNKMLIDATHEEETRVVVLRGERVEEFDLESAARKQLRGNIYLAKVTRVEPSLQAAFIDYGGNRHGFLAFSEIHPDYYQIPVADRQALLDEAAADANDDEDTPPPKAKRPARRRKPKPSAELETKADDGGAAKSDGDGDTPAPAEAEIEGEETAAGDDGAELETVKAQGSQTDDGGAKKSVSGPKPTEAIDDATEPTAAAAKADGETGSEDGNTAGDDSDPPESPPPAPKTIATSEGMGRVRRSRRRSRKETNDDENGAEAASDDDDVESVGAEDALEELPARKPARRRVYKIQEVIKRRQILLVQVVKEERGTKGAALTTYLSLAGRYCVLMPNTARGGGISRKITSHTDRKRLKTIATDMEVPQGMGVIVRTAGANRTKAEIKRDYDYLIRLWETIRELTLKSTAPSLIYEEGSLIKRSIRDLYNKEIAEVLVEGEEAYKEAKAFMKMLMPSHAKNVKQYKEPRALFTRHRVEGQLDQMFSPDVVLPSGGYLVINQTEALVAIDVNSGKSTREHNIEDTALKTNMEAASEVARQLRLRDLAGLIVVDFIDMEEKRNNRSVERRMKESLKTDRARIQVGRISHFGLLEMSRQRIRSSVIEGTMDICPHCEGTGRVRAVGSTALQVMRSIEETALSGGGRNLTIRTSSEIALYMLNQKRSSLSEIENRFGIEISVVVDQAQLGSNFVVEKGAVNSGALPIEESAVQIDTAFGGETANEATEPTASAPLEVREAAEDDSEDGGQKRKRRRRRRGRRRQGEEGSDDTEANAEVSVAPGDASGPPDGAVETLQAGEGGEGAEDGKGRGSRRRGRRGSRRRGREDAPQTAEASANAGEETTAAAPSGDTAEGDENAVAASAEPSVDDAITTAPSAGAVEESPPAPKSRPRRARAKPAKTAGTAQATEPVAEAAPARRRTRKAKTEAVSPPAEPITIKGDAASQTVSPTVVDVAPVAAQSMPAEPDAPSAPPKRGWWQRRMTGG